MSQFSCCAIAVFHISGVSSWNKCLLFLTIFNVSYFITIVNGRLQRVARFEVQV